MQKCELTKYIKSEKFSSIVIELYKDDSYSFIENQRERYLRTLNKAVELFGDGDYYFVSSPGRIEICGNHTDHQNGEVLAASISLDNICAVKKSDDNIVIINDNVFGEVKVDLSDLKINESEKNTSESIVRGIAARIKSLDMNVGGFRAYQDANVLVGSGISSSACFEVLVTEIYNHLYNSNNISDVARAVISKYAENNYFGKPSGLMDQMAISVGGLVNINFFDNDKPSIKKINFNFKDFGYDIFVVNVKASHADLTNEYAAMPNEMKAVAKFFDKDVLSEIDKKVFYEKISEVRNKLKNDRAVLRAIHFFEENDRVSKLVKAIEKKDINDILYIINKSGDFSYKYLQNIYVNSDIKNQPISLALAISEKIITKDGASRVHGGGFAGTILAIVKCDKSDEYVSEMSKIYGKDAILKVCIRDKGTTTIKFSCLNEKVNAIDK